MIEGYKPLLNLQHFSSHFNMIVSSVTGNMVDDCAAKDKRSSTYTAVHSNSIKCEIK